MNEIFVVNSSGENLGRMSFRSAVDIATEQGLELVQVNKDPTSPVYKIMDEGKWKYKQKKLDKQNKKKQHLHPKEIRFRLATEENDLRIKLKKVREFLAKGFDVKLTVLLKKGREQSRGSSAREKLQFLLDGLKDEMSADLIKSTKFNSAVMVHPLKPQETCSARSK